MSLLDKILEQKRRQVAERRKAVPLEVLRLSPGYCSPRRPFEAALRRAAQPVAVIGEIKRASPSRGILRADYDPVEIGRQYEQGGAACLSVLTDEPFFLGSDDHLRLARGATLLPTLRKDFVLEEYQIYESRALGADCILLIVAAFGGDADKLSALFDLGKEEGMDVLVEVHDEAELSAASSIGATLIGINNRNLGTFTTDLAVTTRLAPLAPAGAFVVSESGIFTRDDVQLVRAAGASGVLVGEGLITRTDIAGGVRELLS